MKANSLQACGQAHHSDMVLAEAVRAACAKAALLAYDDAGIGLYMRTLGMCAAAIQISIFRQLNPLMSRSQSGRSGTLSGYA